LDDVTAGQTDETPDELTPQELELEAYYQVMSDYEPDTQIQRRKGCSSAAVPQVEDMGS